MDTEHIYDKKDVYEKKIAHLVQELKITCNMHRMPMFVTVAVANSEEGTEYVNEMVLGSTQVDLKDNSISNILLMLNEFNVEPPKYIQEAVREITAYLERKVQTAENVGVKLKKDVIPTMHTIVNAGDRAVIPVRYAGMDIEDDFDDL